MTKAGERLIAAAKEIGSMLQDRANDDATVEAAAIAYANAWAADIKEYLGKDVPTWNEMGPNQREAMRRVSRSALDAAIQAEREACAKIADGAKEAASVDIARRIRSRK